MPLTVTKKLYSEFPSQQRCITYAFVEMIKKPSVISRTPLTWNVPGKHPLLRAEQADVELVRYAQSHRLFRHRVFGSTM